MPLPPSQQVTFIYVNNLDESHRFYCQTLGFKLALDQGPCRIYQVTPTAFIGVCSGKKVNHNDGVILTFVSSDLEAWHQHLLDGGFTVEKPPSFNEKYNITHLFCRDPDNYLVEIQIFHDPKWPNPT